MSRKPARKAYRPASPLQKRGTSRTWYTVDTRDFIRLLRWRAQFGELYAITGDHDRADILARAIEGEEDPGRWMRGWTYPAIGLRAMAESGLLSMEWAAGIPDFDPACLQETDADRRRFGDAPEFWRISVPEDGKPVLPPNQRPYLGPR